MAEPLYLHATHILSFLPTGEITSRGLSEKDSLLSSMPDEFTTVQWMEAAEHANIPKNTAKTWLRRLCDSGALLHGEHKWDLFETLITYVRVCEERGFMKP